MDDDCGCKNMMTAIFQSNKVGGVNGESTASINPSGGELN